MIEEGKVELSRRRAELVTNLTGPLSMVDRVRIQGALSVINAKIKALNTTLAAQLKTTATQRKVVGPLLNKEPREQEMIEEGKVALSHRRAELITHLTAALSIEERNRIQGELSVINAKIKTLNTTMAAQLKATADQRKVAGLAEAQANAARARANTGTADGDAWIADRAKSSTRDRDAHSEGVRDARENEDEDEDSGQTAAIDAWIDAVLLRHDVDFTRSRTGGILLNAAPKWASVLEVLVAGIYAASRGQELPELSSEAPRPRSTSKPELPSEAPRPRSASKPELPNEAPRPRSASKPELPNKAPRPRSADKSKKR